VKLMTKEGRKYYPYIDISKFFMAILVVTGHTSLYIEWSNPVVLKIYDEICNLVIPFFFIVTGYFITERFKGEFSSPENRKIVFTNLKKTVWVYLIWSVVYLPLAIINYINKNTGLVKALRQYIKGLFVDGEHYNSWMLWYLLSSIYALLFILLLMKCGLNEKALVVVAIIGMVLRMVVLSNYSYLSSHKDDPSRIRYLVKYYGGYGRVFYGFTYVPVGMLISKWKIINKKITGLILLLAGLIAGYFNGGAIYMLCTLVSVIGYFSLTKNATTTNADSIAVKISPFLRGMSTDIYFLHLWVWSIFYMIVYGEKTSGLVSFLGTIIITMIISFVWQLYKLKKKDR